MAAASVGPAVDTVLQRVRDPAGLAHPRSFVRTLLTHAQRIVNLARPGALDEAVLPTQPNRCVYDFVGLTQSGVPVDGSAVARVEGVKLDESENLRMVDWDTLAHVDRNWPRKVAGRPRVWARCGRDLVIVWPARPDTSTVTLVYTKLTAVLASDADAFELRADRLPSVLALTEALLLLRLRRFDAVPAAIAQFQALLDALPTAGGSGVADLVVS